MTGLSEAHIGIEMAAEEDTKGVLQELQEHLRRGSAGFSEAKEEDNKGGLPTLEEKKA